MAPVLDAALQHTRQQRNDTFKTGKGMHHLQEFAIARPIVVGVASSSSLRRSITDISPNINLGTSAPLTRPCELPLLTFTTRTGVCQAGISLLSRIRHKAGTHLTTSQMTILLVLSHTRGKGTSLHQRSAVCSRNCYRKACQSTRSFSATFVSRLIGLFNTKTTL
jgi:hypothetical protein